MPPLCLVPTPIGNLEDITYKAVRILKQADLILAEDTRTTKVLMDRYGITTPLKSFHAHNEHTEAAGIIERLREGKKIAMVTDAGTPGISDPGFLIVRECQLAGIVVECLPGPAALIPALVASGLPADRFIFEGFLPHKKGRKKRIEALADEPRTIIFYESPHRIVKTLNELAGALGKSRPAAIARELTKIHEEILRGTLSELAAVCKEKQILGEIVLVVGGKRKP